MVMGPFRQELADLGVIQLPLQPLKGLLQTLCNQYQIFDVLVEAGTTLSSAFLQEKLVDEMISYVAPTFWGNLPVRCLMLNLSVWLSNFVLSWKMLQL